MFVFLLLEARERKWAMWKSKCERSCENWWFWEDAKERKKWASGRAKASLRESLPSDHLKKVYWDRKESCQRNNLIVAISKLVTAANERHPKSPTCHVAKLCSDVAKLPPFVFSWERSPQNFLHKWRTDSKIASRKLDGTLRKASEQ